MIVSNNDILSNCNTDLLQKHRKKRRPRPSSSASSPHKTKDRRSRKSRADNDHDKRTKPKKRVRKHRRSRSPKDKLNAVGMKQSINASDPKSSSKNLPIITEEDHEDSVSFSGSYIPTRLDASGFFSYHTWGIGGRGDVRPPDEDRIIHSGPSIWHWNWDLSFGLYDDLYDSYVHKNKRHRRSEAFLEDTWLSMDGPIASWQPLFAAMIWFIIAMNILFPVCLIAQSTSCPDAYYDDDGAGAYAYAYAHASNWHAIDRTIHIQHPYAHLSVGLILFAFDVSAWIMTPISSRLILRCGPSWMLFFGVLLMVLSTVGMSFLWRVYNVQFVLMAIGLRLLSGIGFNMVRQSSVFLWSCFAKLDMLASGLGFCCGAVFGDLLYTYLGWQATFIVYAVMLFVLLVILCLVIFFKLLSMAQNSRVDIPVHIKNVRKPRHDLFHNEKIAKHGCCAMLHLMLKFEIFCAIVIGLIALEPTLPIYALNPKLDVTVSGALFTFLYLPLLALASLMGLIFAKSQSRFLNSSKQHVKKQRRGMKYITKTLSINLSEMSAEEAARTQTSPWNVNGSQSINIGGNRTLKVGNSNKRFKVSKSENIKMVDRPSWLAKKKKLLPSPDISHHQLVMLCGLFFTALGYSMLGGGQHHAPFLQFLTLSQDGIDLIAGLVLISIGAALVIMCCVDAFINGLVLAVNQTQVMCVVLNVAILIGPIVGGAMLDVSDHNLPVLSQWWSTVMMLHFAAYLLCIVLQCMYRCLSKCVLKPLRKWRRERHEMQQQREWQQRHEINGNDSCVGVAAGLSKGDESHDQSLTESLIDKRNTRSVQQPLVSMMQQVHVQCDEKTDEQLSPTSSTGSTRSDSDSNGEHSDDAGDADMNAVQIVNDVDGLKQRVKPKRRPRQNVNDPSSLYARKQNKNKKGAHWIYIFGADLRHLCWWKRGCNVRFPYVQWLSSGWKRA